MAEFIGPRQIAGVGTSPGRMWRMREMRNDPGIYDAALVVAFSSVKAKDRVGVVVKANRDGVKAARLENRGWGMVVVVVGGVRVGFSTMNVAIVVALVMVVVVGHVVAQVTWSSSFLASGFISSERG
jgi:hypothetical protein